MPVPHFLSTRAINQAKLLLTNYRNLLGQDLVEAGISDAETALHLFHSPFVVVSAGAEDDPILNYGNSTALELWEMPWEKLTQTPGRHTAEPMHREERAEFLETVRKQGYIENYSGIRISHTGRRFRIHQATVWNLTDEIGNYLGQAATFSHWTHLD